MGVFRQLGDPLAGAVCLCQHHQQAYAEFETLENPTQIGIVYETIADNATIVQVPITITETCCVVVNVAAMAWAIADANWYEIERPLGTPRTQQQQVVNVNGISLIHHAAWEVMPPGVYTYHFVNRRGVPTPVFAAWIKAIASDCEG